MFRLYQVNNRHDEQELKCLRCVNKKHYEENIKLIFIVKMTSQTSLQPTAHKSSVV